MANPIPAADLPSVTPGAADSLVGVDESTGNARRFPIADLSVGFTQSGTGAVTRTVQAKGRERVSVKDYGAAGDGVTDDTAALNTAIAAASAAAVELHLVAGETYLAPTLGSTTRTSLPKIVGNGAVIDGDSQTTAGFVLGTGVPLIDIRGVTFRNFAAPVVKASAIANTIDEVTFVDNVVEDCQKGLYLNCVVKEAMVHGNRFSGLAHTLDLAAVLLGVNTYAAQDTMAKFIVTGNRITDVVSSGTGEEAHGIICYGREAVIKGNIISGVSNANGANCEAIYTKVRFADIEGNVITNCGGDSADNSANIAIKGSVRGSTSSPQGYGVKVRGNTLFGPSTGGAAGIRVENGDCLVCDNYVEGFGGQAIYTASGTFNNIVIRGNHITSHRGGTVIRTQNIGRGLTVSGNRIYNLAATEGVIADAIAIELVNSSGTLNDVDVSENEIYDDGTSAATTRIKGVRVSVSSTRIINRLRISRNKVSITHASLNEFGIDLSNSGSIVDFECKDNDLTGVPVSSTTFPIYDQGTFAGFSGKINIEGNRGYGPIYEVANAAFNIESYHSGTTYSNALHNATRTGTLPVAQVGLWYRFIRVASFAFRIDPDGTDTIRGGGAGKYLELDTDGDSVTLFCFQANKWEIIAGNGTFAYEP